jgi:hypothetical protein
MPGEDRFDADAFDQRTFDIMHQRRDLTIVSTVEEEITVKSALCDSSGAIATYIDSHELAASELAFPAREAPTGAMTVTHVHERVHSLTVQSFRLPLERSVCAAQSLSSTPRASRCHGEP